MKTKDYLSEPQLECLQAVQKINNEMHDKEGWEDHDTLLSITICSYHFFVTLDINKVDTKIDLYSSAWEGESRIYYEKSDTYETWYKFLKRKYRDIKKELESIKL